MPLWLSSYKFGKARRRAYRDHNRIEDSGLDYCSEADDHFVVRVVFQRGDCFCKKCEIHSLQRTASLTRFCGQRLGAI